MDGVIADLKSICDLADKYDALVMVDDSPRRRLHRREHSRHPRILWRDGQGRHHHRHLGKALGGASGGYTSGKKEVIDWLRQRSRPYLFSNSLAPPSSPPPSR